MYDEMDYADIAPPELLVIDRRTGETFYVDNTPDEHLVHDPDHGPVTIGDQVYRRTLTEKD